VSRPHSDGSAAAAGFVLALVLAMLAVLALVHWLECGTQAVALCVAPAARTRWVRLRHWRWAWADRAWSAFRAACLRVQLQWEQDALENMEEAHAALPVEISAQRDLIAAMRLDLVVTESAARGEA